MKDYGETIIFGLMVALMMVGVIGCATAGSGLLTDDQKAQSARAKEFVKNACPTVRLSSYIAVKLALQYAEQDNEAREKLRLQIFMVSSQLSQLLNRGEFHPDEVTQALKVKEKYVSDLLEATGLLYRATYDQLEGSDNAEMAIDLLKALADGVKDGTK